MAEMNAYVAMVQSVLGNAEVRIGPSVTVFLCLKPYASIACSKFKWVTVY